MYLYFCISKFLCFCVFAFLHFCRSHLRNHFCPPSNQVKSNHQLQIHLLYKTTQVTVRRREIHSAGLDKYSLPYLRNTAWRYHLNPHPFLSAIQPRLQICFPPPFWRCEERAKDIKMLSFTLKWRDNNWQRHCTPKVYYIRSLKIPHRIVNILYTYTAERRDVLGCTSPTTKRFSEAREMSRGTSRGPREISRSEGMYNLIHPDSRKCTAILSS